MLRAHSWIFQLRSYRIVAPVTVDAATRESQLDKGKSSFYANAGKAFAVSTIFQYLHPID